MYDTIVIGAGQAGLAVGYYLKLSNQNFLLLEKGNEVGESWKERYDSLVLFTSRMYCSLPGMDFEGEAQGSPTKDEVVTYLKKYAFSFNIPIKFQSEVVDISKMNGNFLIRTKTKEYVAKNLVSATGPFQTPIIPKISMNLSSNVNQLHSSQYKNPNQLVDGNVLVVGGGNSGAQIAVELSKERETFLAVSKKLRYLPLIVNKKSIFWWFDKIGILNATNNSLVGQLIQQKGDLIFGFELKEIINQKKVILKKRVIEGTQNQVIFEDSTSLEVRNIIWATGFKTEFSWLKIDGVLNEDGKVLHHRGVSQINGLYFIGLPWQYRRGSALLQGVGYDAKYVVEKISDTSN